MGRFHTAWHNIRRSPYQALLAIAITSLTFFVFGIVVYSAMLSSALLTYFEQKPQITAFFKDDKNTTAVENLKNLLQKTGKIASIKFISKEEALKIYQEQNKSDPLLLEMVTADILPSSLEISAKDPRDLADLAKIIKSEPQVDEIIYQKDIIDTLLIWTDTIRKSGVLLIIFFSLLSILVTLTITGMKIVLRKEEIDILKLVGATKSYISLPFIAEGIAYGVMGATIGGLLMYIFLLYATPFLVSLFQGYPRLVYAIPVYATTMLQVVIWPISLQALVVILAVLWISGFIIGLAGSLIALTRYVRF